QNPSAIMGQLLSNGHVFLINPNGVVFGANAVVDTAGLVASSLNMSDESFLSGKYKFSGDASNGAVINRGLITAGKGGEIVLIAPTVENHGVISVEGGRILLAAGEKMTLSSMDLEGIEFEVQAPTNTAMNLGKLLASGGSVGVFAGSLTNTGVINANSVTKGKDGKIWLEASGTATVGGKLSAPDITIAGSDIALNGADISASTEAGGGQIRIGGDYQGADLGPNVANAKSVTIDAATTISASAQSQGDGGRVIVWSDENTVVNGHISATGGSESGNGGFVETSGKKALDFTTPVDVSASNGKAGTWLIDPEDITIDESKASSIETALNEGSNVEIKTSDTGEGEGNITVASAITKSEGGDASLSLDAHNRIDVNASITSTSNKLDVKLTAGNQVNVNSSITTNGGSVATLITGTSATVETGTEPVVDSTTPETVVEPAPEAIETAEETIVASIDTTTENSPTVGEELADLNTSIIGSIDTSGGDISIGAGETGSVLVTGTLDASNLDTGETGGNIEVLGDQVALAGEALLDASGDAGGGTIKVGGDYQGQGDTPTATNTSVGEEVVIKADAVTEGDGGNIFVWSDDTTEFHGNISATGGEQSGDGGFAEVSGKQHLVMTGHANLHAVNGETGTLLLDPGSVDIEAGAADPSAQMDTFYTDWITLQLDGNGIATDPNEFGSNLIISTANSTNGATEDINVNAEIAWGSNNSLTLDAGNDININDHVNNTNYFDGTATLTLNAGGDVNIMPQAGSGDGVWVSAPGMLTVNATNLNLTGGVDYWQYVGISSDGPNGAINITLDGNFMLAGGDGADSSAEIYSAGTFTIKLDGKLSVLGGAGEDAYALLTAYDYSNQSYSDISIAGKTSTRNSGIDVISGALGADASAEITGANVDIKTGSLQVKADQGYARIGSDLDMNIRASSLNIIGGTATDAFAYVQSANNQTVNVDGTLSIRGGSGFRSDAALYLGSYFEGGGFAIIGGGEIIPIARISTSYKQSISAGNILIQGGSGTLASASILNQYGDGGPQSITASGNISVIGGSGQYAHAEIKQSGRGDQIITAGGDLTVQGGNADAGEGGLGAAYASIYAAYDGTLVQDMNMTVNVGGNLQVLGGTNSFGGGNYASIHNIGSVTLPTAGMLTVNVGGTTLLRGGLGTNDVAALSAYTTMTLNSLGDVTLEGGSGTNADAFIAGATSPDSLNTIYLNAGDPNNLAVLNFLGNSYLIDGGGAGDIFINTSGCNPVGSCTATSPNILAGNFSATFYDPAAVPVVPGSPGTGIPPIFIPPALLPIVNFYNPALSQVLAMNDEAYDEMQEDDEEKKKLEEIELALMCN
ncbi:MAG: filamentous hemagglutinin N-terminal domain-containing protein, partial [Gammaproteobacteria bacterium]|nr:filamentous hemagglutinin N-terminal domain-containing protein [Gammaproteobacteria bacterium]